MLKLRSFFFIVTPTALCNGLFPTSGDKPPDHGKMIQMSQKPSKHCTINCNHLHIHQWSPHLSILHALSCDIHHHTSATEVCLPPNQPLVFAGVAWPSGLIYFVLIYYVPNFLFSICHCLLSVEFHSSYGR